MSTSFTHGRVLFHAARATLRVPAATPPGMVPGRLSILSPGTEQRRMDATQNGPDRDAGYMNIATIPAPAARATAAGSGIGQAGDEGADGVHVVAPVPHGAAFTPSIPGALTAGPGTDVNVLAVARFQLIAARGLDRVPAALNTALSTRRAVAVPDGRGLTTVADTLGEVVVVGSGPVALGCVLELRRRGADQIRVITSRLAAPISAAPGVICVDPASARRAPFVVDAAGAPGRACTLATQTGVVGLLGTPAAVQALDAAAVHRSGTVVVGMHELAGARPDAADTRDGAGRPLGASWCASYQDTYTAVVNWLISDVDPAVLRSWCQRIPGEQAPEIYARLRRGDRPPAPIVLWDWS